MLGLVAYFLRPGFAKFLAVARKQHWLEGKRKCAAGDGAGSDHLPCPVCREVSANEKMRVLSGGWDGSLVNPAPSGWKLLQVVSRSFVRREGRQVGEKHIQYPDFMVYPATHALTQRYVTKLIARNIAAPIHDNRGQV